MIVNAPSKNKNSAWTEFFIIQLRIQKNYIEIILSYTILIRVSFSHFTYSYWTVTFKNYTVNLTIPHIVLRLSLLPFLGT